MFIVYNVEFLCNVTQKKKTTKKNNCASSARGIRIVFQVNEIRVYSARGAGGKFAGTVELGLNSPRTGIMEFHSMKQSVVRRLELTTWWSIGEGGVGGVRGGGGGVGGV